MEPSPSTDPPAPTRDALTVAESELLLDIADAAIREGLIGNNPSMPELDGLPSSLAAPMGVFVTLTVDGELNGCIGTVEADEPLARSTARHAWSAAFDDPRLPKLRASDYEKLAIEVSVLSPVQAVESGSREEVMRRLRPGVDGLLLGTRHSRAVFLPSVWEQLPDRSDFVDHLLRKAGLSGGSWPEGVRAWCFTATKLLRRKEADPPPLGA
jgi:AmmeMemoRadiSam system protein A